MKNNGLTIALIILLSIIVFLLVIFLVACLKGNIGFQNGFFFGHSESTNVISENTFQEEEISKMEIIQDAGDVLIKKSENHEIRVVLYGEDTKEASVDLNDNQLRITHTDQNRFGFFSFGVKKSDVIVYLPSDYAGEIKIKNSYGRCEILDLENATIEIDCDAGDVELGKIKNADIRCDCGNIEIEEVLNWCNLQVDCGNVEIEKMTIQENSSIKVDLGNIDIQEINDIYIEAKVDMGRANVRENNRNADISLQIHCDCGNISVGE